MKKYMLMLLLVSTSVFARPYFVIGGPVLTVKAGGYPESSAGKTVAGPGGIQDITLSLETRACNYYVNCFDPYVIAVNSYYGHNAGAGFDYVYKFAKRVPDNFYLAIGPVAFAHKIDNKHGNRWNAHIGLGFRMYSLIVSVDAYGEPNNTAAEQYYMFNVGYQFK